MCDINQKIYTIKGYTRMQCKLPPVFSKPILIYYENISRKIIRFET